jgi:hypothetical protein
MQRGDGSGPVLWFFYSKVWDVGSVTPVYNGWYLSDHIDTSFVSAKHDYYACRGLHDMPFDDASTLSTSSSHSPRSWITICSSVLPTGGCGVAPPPIITPSPDCIMLRHVIIQRSSGALLHLHIPVNSSIFSIKLSIQQSHRLPAHCQCLLARSHPCPDTSSLSAIFPSQRREACFFVLLERTYADLLHLPLANPCRTIAIIGGGPVGLWVALQMKLLAQEWDVHVFEKREAYARSHALRLLPLSFEGMLTKECGGMSALHDLVDQWVAAGSSPRTNDIERQLSAGCEVAGVTIHRNQGSVTGTLRTFFSHVFQ